MLRPGRPFLFNVWDHIDRNDFTLVATDALAEIFPDDPPRFMARTPHGYHDPDLIRRQLGEAGFADVAIEVVAARSRAASAHEAAFALCEGTPLRGEIESRAGAGALPQVTRRVGDALARRFGAGPVDGAISALVVTAR